MTQLGPVFRESTPHIRFRSGVGIVHLYDELEIDLGPLTYTLPRSKNRRLRLTSRVRPMRRLLPIEPIGRTAVPSQRGPAAT